MSDGAIRHHQPHNPAKCGGCRLQRELDFLRAAPRWPSADDETAVEDLAYGMDNASLGPTHDFNLVMARSILHALAAPPPETPERA